MLGAGSVIECLVRMPHTLGERSVLAERNRLHARGAPRLVTEETSRALDQL
jgi:hypothetical protein